MDCFANNFVLQFNNTIAMKNKSVKQPMTGKISQRCHRNDLANKTNVKCRINIQNLKYKSKSGIKIFLKYLDDFVCKIGENDLFSFFYY